MAENSRSILPRVVYPNIIRNKMAAGFDLITDECLDRTNLLFGLAVSTCKLVHRTSCKEHRGHVSVRGHERGVAVGDLDRGISRITGAFPIRAPQSVVGGLRQERHCGVLCLLPLLNLLPSLLLRILYPRLNTATNV